MNAHPNDAGSARKTAPVHLLFEGDFHLAAPLKAVWGHILNYPSWQDFSIREHISGPPGGEGEVVLLRKVEPGFTFPPYYALTIKVDPEARAFWKVYLAEKTPDERFFGFVDFKVRPEQGGTRFSYNTIYEFEVPYSQERELEVFRTQQSEQFQAMFSGIFAKLKKLAEQGG